MADTSISGGGIHSLSPRAEAAIPLEVRERLDRLNADYEDADVAQRAAHDRSQEAGRAFRSAKADLDTARYREQRDRQPLPDGEVERLERRIQAAREAHQRATEKATEANRAKTAAKTTYEGAVRYLNERARA